MHRQSCIALGAVIGTMLFSVPAWGQASAGGEIKLESPPLTDAEVAALVNPVAMTPESIKRGRILYFALDCQSCHGDDGKANTEVVGLGTDLTDVKLWRSGTKDEEVFRSIRDGAGIAMPPYRGQLTRDEQVWDLVNFMKSLWPAERR